MWSVVPRGIVSWGMLCVMAVFVWNAGCWVAAMVVGIGLVHGEGVIPLSCAIIVSVIVNVIVVSVINIFASGSISLIVIVVRLFCSIGVGFVYSGLFFGGFCCGRRLGRSALLPATGSMVNIKEKKDRGWKAKEGAYTFAKGFPLRVFDTLALFFLYVRFFAS